LLFNPYYQSLEYTAGRGFYNLDITHTRLRLGEELAGKTALERRLNLKLMKIQNFLHLEVVLGVKIYLLFRRPLVSKGSLKGVLEVFYRTRFAPDLEWLDYLEHPGRKYCHRPSTMPPCSQTFSVRTMS